MGCRFHKQIPPWGREAIACIAQLLLGQVPKLARGFPAIPYRDLEYIWTQKGQVPRIVRIRYRLGGNEPENNAQRGNIDD